MSQQAGAIPFRRNDGEVSICLIRRNDSRKWSIPKGLIDPGQTPEETALNETLEEAGLQGRVVAGPIGSYTYEKWEVTFTVAVYLLEVEGTLDDWLESWLRERRWVTFRQAESLLANHPVRSLLDDARRLLLEGDASDGEE